MTLRPTGKIVLIGGARCRVWLGQTDKGTEVQALIAMIAIPDEYADQRPQLAAELREAERELEEIKPVVQAFPRVIGTDLEGRPLLPPQPPKRGKGN